MLYVRAAIFVRDNFELEHLLGFFVRFVVTGRRERNVDMKSFHFSRGYNIYIIYMRASRIGLFNDDSGHSILSARIDCT